MLGKSTHLQVISQQSTQNTAICHYRHTRKTNENFSLFNTGVDFANSGSFAKVSVAVNIYISLVATRNYSFKGSYSIALMQFLNVYQVLI